MTGPVTPDPVLPTDELPVAVLWDLDGTVIRGEDLWTVGHQQTALALGRVLSEGALAALVGADVDPSVEIILNDLSLPVSDESTAWVRGHLLGVMAVLYSGELEWMPGARAALDLVRAAGIPSALVTNTPRALTEVVLDGIGRDWFTVTVCADECPAGKPAPDPYRRAAERLGVPTSGCVAVEDSPSGVLSAERAGAAVLVVPDRLPVEPGPRRTYRPDLVGLTLDELAAARGRVRVEPTFTDVMESFSLDTIPRRRRR